MRFLGAAPRGVKRPFRKIRDPPRLPLWPCATPPKSRGCGAAAQAVAPLLLGACAGLSPHGPTTKEMRDVQGTIQRHADQHRFPGGSAGPHDPGRGRPRLVRTLAADVTDSLTMTPTARHHPDRRAAPCPDPPHGARGT